MHSQKDTTSSGDSGFSTSSSLGSSNIGSSAIPSSAIGAGTYRDSTLGTPGVSSSYGSSIPQEQVRNFAIAGVDATSSGTSSSSASSSTYPSSDYSSGPTLSSGTGIGTTSSGEYGTSSTSSSLSSGSAYPSSGINTSSALPSGADYSSTPVTSSLASGSWANSKLTLVVHRALNLPKGDWLSKSDPYVRVRFDKQRPKDALKGHKAVDKNSENPMFEQKFFFDLEGTERELLIEIMDADILKDDVLAYANIPIEVLMQHVDQQPFVVNLLHKTQKKHDLESQVELSVLRDSSGSGASGAAVAGAATTHQKTHHVPLKHHHHHQPSSVDSHKMSGVGATDTTTTTAAAPTTFVPAAVAASSSAAPAREEDIFDKIARKLHLQDEAPGTVTEVPSSTVKRNPIGEPYIPTATEERRANTK